MAIKLQRLFVINLLGYSILCIGITIVCVLDKSLRYADLKAAAAATDGILRGYEVLGIASLEFERWFRKCQRLTNRCSQFNIDDAMHCSSKALMQAVDLFFMYLYVLLGTMLLAFLVHRLLWRSSGAKGGKGKKRSNSIPTEVPPLQACYTDEEDELLLHSLSHDFSGDSGDGGDHPSSPRHSSLVFDETFGIIEKSILDSWGHVEVCAKPMGMSPSLKKAAGANSLLKRRVLPPVRNSNPVKSNGRGGISTPNGSFGKLSSLASTSPSTSATAASQITPSDRRSPAADGGRSGGGTTEKRKKNSKS